MAERVYKGLVIGGPLDGQLISHWDTIYPVHPRPRAPAGLEELARFEPPPPISYYFSSSIYHHGETRKEIAFWVLKDQTILDAFEAVMTRYQEPNATKAILERLGTAVHRSGALAYMSYPDGAEVIEAMKVARDHLNGGQS